MCMLPDFKFHRMCKAAQLTNLIFVDDLMQFRERDSWLSTQDHGALTHFSDVIRLVANIENSSIFMARVTDEVKSQIIA